MTSSPITGVIEPSQNDEVLAITERNQTRVIGIDHEPAVGKGCTTF